MFTGLIEETGKVVSVKSSGEGKILGIKGKRFFRKPLKGILFLSMEPARLLLILPQILFRFLFQR